jgi:hypothetical protein
MPFSLLVIFYYIILPTVYSAEQLQLLAQSWHVVFIHLHALFIGILLLSTTATLLTLTTNRQRTVQHAITQLVLQDLAAWRRTRNVNQTIAPSAAKMIMRFHVCVEPFIAILCLWCKRYFAVIN